MFPAIAAGASATAQKKRTAIPSFISPAAKGEIDRSIQALGGSAFVHWKSLYTTGKVFMIQDHSTAGFAPYKSIEVPPDQRRFTYGRGAHVTLINNGDVGWEIDRYGVIQQTPQQIRAWKIANRYSLGNVLRVTFHEPGIFAEDKGLTLKDNEPVYEVEIIDRHQVRIDLYLDEESSLPREITYRVRNPRTQHWEEYSDVYSNYQVFQGIETPMHITRYLAGSRIGELFRDKVHYNAPVASNSFSAPR